MFGNQPQQQQDEPFPSMSSMLSWLVFTSRVGAMTLEVFFHKDFGSRYFGFQALAACFLILFWSLGWEGYDVKELVWFLGAYLFMVLVARIGVMRRWLRGERHVHSYYSGCPRLGPLLPKLSESAIRRAVEPALGLLAGALLCDLSEPLGTYIMFAAACLFFSCGIDEIWQQTSAANLDDAMVEQEALVGRFRRMRRR